MQIPQGVRLAHKVPDNECKVCNLSTSDHTVNFSFPVEDRSASDGVAYQKVCLKDWAKYNKKEAKTMDESEKIIEGEGAVVNKEEAPSPAPKVRDELKVSVIIKGDHVFIGAQATDCDPKMTFLTGDLAAALERIPSFIEESNQQWDVSSRNPKSSVPEPTPPAPKRSATTAASKPAPAKPAQASFF
ncbi:MAG: hypothetical protein JXA46_11790 [Dehalococcoidales bacterium]|nr:hypothetical protein [Dehalococcoidales bacterium]